MVRCKLPTEGHLTIPRPRRVFLDALRRVERSWEGPERERAAAYLRRMIQYQFKSDIPLWIFRPEDLMESPLGRNVADRVVRELERLGKRTCDRELASAGAFTPLLPGVTVRIAKRRKAPSVAEVVATP